MEKFLPFHVPEIGQEEIDSVVETLQSGWLTTGSKVKQFEEDFAKHVGARYAIAVNSCTAALHLALEAIGLQEGDEVIVPTMTFAATAEVVTYFKARPVLVDCCSDTLNIDVEQIAKAITPKTKAIIPVHFGGQPCDLDSILDIAKAKNLYVIEDAAHALPAHYRGNTIGSISDITCFSFYVTKSITTGEGGMATTNDSKWAERMRSMSLHGLSQDAWKRHSSQGSWYYEIVSPGYKYNMTDIAASLGIAQLRKCERFWEIRRSHAAMYNEGFHDVSQISVPFVRDEAQHAWHLYVIQLNLKQLRIGRNEFIELLRKDNIGTSVHFIPLHLHPYYRETFGYGPKDFPVATAVFDQTLSLPIYPKMTEAHVQTVIHSITKILKQYQR